MAETLVKDVTAQVETPKDQKELVEELVLLWVNVHVLTSYICSGALIARRFKPFFRTSFMQ